MKAIGLTRYLPISDPESLTDVEIEKPSPSGNDLLVAVKAISVNPVDTKIRAPNPRVEESPRILGYDAAGVVETVGPDVTLFKPGDEVFYAGDITRPGSNAEYQLVDERIVGSKPETLDFAEAAALPLTAITAYEAFFDRLGIDPEGSNAGQTLLILGGAGGVGSIAIQLAKIAGLTVIATASRPESIDWVRSLGADQIVSHAEPLRPQIEALGLKDVDFIAVFNDNGDNWDAVADLIRPQGAVVSIVGAPDQPSQGRLGSKSVTFAWELMFTRPRFKTPDMIEQHKLLNRVASWIDDGTIRTTVNRILRPITAENLRAAHEMIEAGHTVGKIVLADWREATE